MPNERARPRRPWRPASVRPRPEPGVRRDPTRSEDTKGLGGILDELLGRRPWRAGMALGELGKRWSEVVGERLAAESVPAALEGGALVVRASSAAWAGQIGFLSAQVVSRANEVMGAEEGQGPVTSVRVTVDPGPRERSGGR